MASETVDPIDWSHPPPYTGPYPLSSTYWTLQSGLCCKSQDLLHWESLDRATFGMPDQRTACAATQGINSVVIEGDFPYAVHLKRSLCCNILNIQWPRCSSTCMCRSHVQSCRLYLHLQSCRSEPGIALAKRIPCSCRQHVGRGRGTPRPVFLTRCKRVPCGVPD